MVATVAGKNSSFFPRSNFKIGFPSNLVAAQLVYKIYFREFFIRFRYPNNWLINQTQSSIKINENFYSNIFQNTACIKSNPGAFLGSRWGRICSVNSCGMVRDVTLSYLLVKSTRRVSDPMLSRNLSWRCLETNLLFYTASCPSSVMLLWLVVFERQVF